LINTILRSAHIKYNETCLVVMFGHVIFEMDASNL